VPELVDNHTEFGDASLYTTSFIFAMNKEAMTPAGRSEGGHRRQFRRRILRDGRPT
jgi:hypothetical protein